MYAVRQIQKVENGKVVVQLPDDFPVDQVEVIILPAQAVSDQPAEKQDEGVESIKYFLNMDTSNLNEEQLEAYQRTCELLREWLVTRKSPLFGAFAGLVEISDDFDDPLPDEILDLFYEGNLEPSNPQL
jgi:hypothetical protein